jgi:thioredoxin reductase (NADPH)
MAAKPVLMTVDDDTDVLRAIERDLRRQYGGEYRVLRADSGQSALDALKQLQQRNETVALFLVDQRMPQMSGVEFLQQARPLFPEARRVLLTAYADTDAAIQAINSVQIDHYLLKPWDPPEQNLYPVLTDLLDAWQSTYHPPYGGIRVLGHRWSPQSHQVKDFLARNHVPYQWFDVEKQDTDSETKRLVDAVDGDIGCLPLVFFADGTRLLQPANAELAAKVGMNTQAQHPFYDLVIIGAGPAGLAAAVYGASEGLATLIIEREAPGGQAGTSSHIDNYLGFPSGLTGADLANRAVIQARRFGAEILSPREAVGIKIEDPYRTVILSDGSEINCHALLIASGVAWRMLDAPGVERLTGAGVYYGAAMTEAMSCKDDDVYIVGGANSAGQAAIFFAKYARTVIMLVRGDSLAKSMSKYLIDEIENTPNITLRTCTQVLEAHGEASLEALTLVDANAESGQPERVPAKALFIMIGADPHTEWLGDGIGRDDHGFLITGPDLIHDGKRPQGWTADRDPMLLETSIPGVFAAGDVWHGGIKRVAFGVGSGAMAVSLIHQYLSKVK